MLCTPALLLGQPATKVYATKVHGLQICKGLCAALPPRFLPRRELSFPGVGVSSGLWQGWKVGRQRPSFRSICDGKQPVITRRVVLLKATANAFFAANKTDRPGAHSVASSGNVSDW